MCDNDKTCDKEKKTCLHEATCTGNHPVPEVGGGYIVNDIDAPFDVNITINTSGESEYTYDSDAAYAE